MKYSDKTILDYKVGDIVYVKLNNNTISQAKFTDIKTKIYWYSNLHLLSNFFLKLPNGDLIESYKDDNGDKSINIYSSVEDVKNDIRIIIDSHKADVDINNELIKFLATQKVKASSQSLGRCYKTGVQISRNALNRVLYYHGTHDTEYEMWNTGKTVKYTENELNEFGYYLSEEEARNHSNINVIKFEEPKETTTNIKIKLAEGCTGETLYVNEQIIEPDNKQLGILIHELVGKLIETQPEYVYTYISDLIHQLGNITDEHYCDQCHDTSYTYELEV